MKQRTADEEMYNIKKRLRPIYRRLLTIIEGPVGIIYRVLRLPLPPFPVGPKKIAEPILPALNPKDPKKEEEL